MEKQKFAFRISRTIYEGITAEVEAENEEQAYNLVVAETEYEKWTEGDRERDGAVITLSRYTYESDDHSVSRKGEIEPLYL